MTRQPAIPPPTGSVFTGAQGGTFSTGRYRRHSYKLYVPARYQPDTAMPLLVLLHGCGQTSDTFATATEMNHFAEEYGCIVLYPEQAWHANMRRLWNWFRPQHQQRGRGEPALITAMVAQVMQQYTIHPGQVYVAGLADGAAMATILGATYPDLFAAIGVCSGVPYRSAVRPSEATLAMRGGNADPARQGSEAYQAMGEYQRAVPVIIFQGTSDRMVNVVNAQHLVDQWMHTNLLANGYHHLAVSEHVLNAIETSEVPGGHTYTEYTYDMHSCSVVIKLYLVNGMGHAWPGGLGALPYTDPAGPKASRLMVEFFLDHPYGRVRQT